MEEEKNTETAASVDPRAKLDAATADAGLRKPITLMTKSQILQTPDREYRIVDMSRWWGAGMSVRVQSLTAGERDSWEASHVKQRKGEQIVNIQTVRASLVALALVDEKDQLIFTAEEIFALQGKNAAAINHIYVVAATLSGVTDEDLEELAGNSVSARTGATS
jgi:hypothetical protein